MWSNNLRTNPYPLGAYVEGDGIRFSFASKSDSCGVLLYERASGELLQKIPFTQAERAGNVYCKTVKDICAEKITYQFFEDEKIVPDPRAKIFSAAQGKFLYGEARKTADFKAGFLTESFDWEEDRNPRLPYHEVIAYCIHVRGFTRHNSSKVKAKGTFAGIIEKIPYFKEIGVTTLELQPAYEFTELPTEEEKLDSLNKLNYWGYKKGYYDTPKAAYASSENPVNEFKELVKALHRNQMELIMQFYFPNEVRRSEIADILRFWVLEYHVDGFHLMGENMPADMLASDALLADTKLWYYQFDVNSIYKKEEQPVCAHLAEYNDNWYYDMRKYLKGEENMLDSVLYHMRHIPKKAGSIHYISNYFGFTLSDLVSYEEKHNEENGEYNLDGTDYNCSWNCGEEGPTKKQKIIKLRERQIKNAMCLLLFSQSTPLIFMGDEFGNSQMGNNNPYCQDNEISWLDWDLINQNSEILEFWKLLVEFRKTHEVLHPESEMRMTDYIGCGYPDLSYHGKNAWKPETEAKFRHIGMMLCSRYAKQCLNKDFENIYITMNMHWKSHELALPKSPKGSFWKLLFTTGTEGVQKNNCVMLPPRTIAVYVTD